MIGEKLDRYNLLEEIGSGSMGTVYRAEDLSTGRIVAVKLVKANVLYDSSRRERFLHGLLLASQIRHPGICPILEIGDEEDDFYIVTPFLEGETLAQRMKRRPLPWHQTMKLGIAICEALDAVHRAGAVHRSLKPSNVWIARDGSVVLTDSCVARFTEMNGANEAVHERPRREFADTIIPMGALAYMSPEQIRGEPVDHRSDIFALGAILYEMLSDRHPFEARNSLSRISAILESNPARLTSRKQNLPQAADAVLRKSMERRPELRYRDAQEMASALQEILDGRSGADVDSRGSLPIGRGRFARWAILGLAAILVTAVISLLYVILSR